MKPLLIEVYPMTNEDTLADKWVEVFHYDVLIRPDGGDPIEEFENLARAEVDEIVDQMMVKYPGATPDYQLLDLLSQCSL